MRVFLAILLLALAQAEVTGEITLGTPNTSATTTTVPNVSLPQDAFVFIGASVAAMLLLMWWFWRDRE